MTAPKCASPGEPARLEVRPSRKLLRTGESFTFNALVLDSSGCGTSTPTNWKIEGDARGLTVDDHGTATAAADATEGTVTIVVTAAGKSTRVTVDLATAAHYDDLLKSSGLNAAGETDTASVVVIAEGSIGGSDVRAGGSAKKRNIFLGVIGGLVVVLGVFGVIGWRRSRRAAELHKKVEERHAEKVREVEERRRDKAEKHAEQMRAHEESLKKREEAIKSTPPPPIATICPSCQREFPPDAQYCPHDGNRLVPMNVGSGIPRPPPMPAIKPPDSAIPSTPQRKICPTCGQRFQGDAAFCGKDGSALVLLN